MRINIELDDNVEDKNLSEIQILNQVALYLSEKGMSVPLDVIPHVKVHIMDPLDFMENEKSTFVENLSTGDVFFLYIDMFTLKLEARKIFSKNEESNIKL
jgi:hypothetical protein